jgi:diketogulonate reductase-like aldo/keto reductase
MNAAAWPAGVGMQRKQLAQTGVMLPEIGFGTYRYRGGVDLLRNAIERGVSLIDTAELYGNEEVVGEAMKHLQDRVFVATKTNHWRYDEVLKCAEASLKRLGCDLIDLYQVHWPNAAVPIAETMAAMEALVDGGKVRFIGVSNFTVSEMQEAQRALRKQKIVSNQIRYNLVDRTIERDLLPYCQRNHVTVIAYSPLGNSFQRILGSDPEDALGKVAKMTNRTKAQVALNWCLSKAGVVVIPKTELMGHLVENCGSSDWRLSNEQIALLDDGIRYRSRSRWEVALRRCVRRTLQRLSSLLK